MSYQTALTIAEVVHDIHKKKYLLPAIQREFVWDTDQIEKLFDSLMRDYPINSFLFWTVSKEKVFEYEFYEFLREYHEKNNTHNPKANVTGEEEVIAVLDGQQRLTSLYLALKGSYAYKLPRKRWDNDQAFPKRKLYLNLLQHSSEVDRKFEFVFLTEKESKENDKDSFWFPVEKILILKESYDVNQYLIDNGLFTEFGKDKASFANKTLSKLHSVIHLKSTISYYLEKSSDLDKVLNIFIRINSGGTILSYSDLLLSIATAQWEEKDAREEITSFVEELNNIGDGFNFNKDFVLKSCLVLCGFTNIAFIVDNFNKKNMLRIESDWEEITSALRIAVGLVSSFGYNRDTLTSNNAIIPIAYYIRNNEIKDSFISSSKNTEEKSSIKKWLVLSLIKRAFSGQPDNVLRPLRKIIKDNGANFPLDKIIAHFKGTNKTLIFSDEDIENLTWHKYGQNFTFSVLTLLYPYLDYRNQFHVDHIFPKSLFTASKLRKRGVSEDNIDTYKLYLNYLGNLQLLEAVPNIEKSNKEFDVWFSQIYKTEKEKSEYRKKHYIPDVDISFTNFVELFEKREDLLTKKLKEILQIQTEKPRIRRRITK
ncbi:MAG: DUF262 domain-containing protein [Desulfobacterales bacterium]|nr:DUF262 domain-containing protein [Desulfobacterales bacterium]MDD4072747.1 DUF262 domain-containing protein [Desulfobacterales bacterium]MDD4392463.1 DUF262 domain-containing protein [Desulfobacterales bacterium]